MTRHLTTATILATVAAATWADNLRLSFDVIPLASEPQTLHALDADLDGHADLVATYVNPPRWQVIRGGPDGKLTPGPTLPLPGNGLVYRVATGDLNADGFDDLVVASGTGTSLTILLSTPGVGLTEPAWSPIQSGTNPRAVLVADATGDGMNDILVVTNNTLFIHPNGEEGFATPRQYQLPAGGGGALAVADIDGDKTPEIAILSNLDLNLFTIVNDALEQAFSYRFFHGNVGLTPIDADGDGLTDLVVPVPNANQASVVRFDPVAKQFVVSEANLGATGQTHSFAAGSLTPGGPVHIVQGFASTSLAGILYSDPLSPPNFFSATEPAFGEFAGFRHPAILDVNGDGLNDIAFSTPQPGIAVFFQDPTGGFRGAGFGQDFNPNPALFRPLPRTVPSDPQSFLVVDFISRVLTLSPDGPGVTIDSTAVPTISGSRLTEFTLADINNDGVQDLAQIVSTASPAQIAWQLGRPDGTFGIRVSRTISNQEIIHLESADFNQDGYADIATVADDGFGYVLFGSASGVLSPPVQVGLSPFGNSIAQFRVVDLDGDGNHDLVATRRNSGGAPGGIFIAYGRGDGTFQESTTLPANNITAVSSRDVLDVGHLNNDPFPDIAVATTSGVQVYLTEGFRRFLPPQVVISSTGSNLKSVTVTDFDGDGRAEIVAVGAGVGEIVGHSPSGPFTRRLRFPFSNETQNTFLTDVDLDGLPDIVSGSTTVSVIFNRSTPYCPVDFDRDGRLNFIDVALFLQSFSAGAFGADLNYDGRIDFFDVSTFMRLYQEGCK